VALADRFIDRGIYTVYLSTNQVFDGSVAHVPPHAPHSPVSAYGHQKARTEAELIARLAQGAPVAILRLAKVVSRDMTLLRDWIEALMSGRPIRAFSDMMMAPTPTDLVAKVVAALLVDRPRGIFQLSGPRDISYAELARDLAKRLSSDVRLVEPVTATLAGMPVGATPRHTTLDSRILQEHLGLVVPGTTEIVEDVIRANKAIAPLVRRSVSVPN